jgi:hypothetical protein
MHNESHVAPVGALSLRKISRVRKAPLSWRLRNLPNLLRGLPGVLAAWTVFYLFGIPSMIGSLRLRVAHADGSFTDYGLVGMRVVTTVGVGYIVDAFQNIVEVENMKFHGFGTGGTAEAVGDTALVTEETTQYNPDSTRPTGSTTEGASGNIYRTVGTYSPDSGATRAITEHGIFSQAAAGGGTLLDRTLFSVVNLVAGSDSLQATYDLTFTAGS